MAAVDFGDSQLFQQLDDASVRVAKHIHFTDDEEHQEQRSRQRSRLEECEDYIERLTEENKGLRRKQSILMRPSGITIEDVNVDGPVLQILYSNNAISKQCRQEIEDCMCNVILKHQNPSNENKKSTIHMIPQTMQAILGSPGPSMNLGDPQSIAGSSARYSSGSLAFALDEDPQMSLSSSIKTTTEAFKVVGSVLYFTTFSLDKLGQPLVNENPQLTDGWDVPMYLKDQSYHQIFNQVIGTDGQEIEMKDKRPKSMCFNCGSSNHQLRDCPMPKDMAVINERRKEFNQNSSQIMQSNQRYHADEVEERFAKYKPGVMSEELLTALGIDDNALPPLIYRMRQLGYPPGWLKEAEMENSGLTLYDGNVSNDNNITDDTNSQSICYDVSKLIDFPGFNVPTPNTMKDEYMQYGSVPMQYNHMKQNFAAYLSSNFPLPGATCNKRPHESDSSPQAKKRTRPSPCGSSDMDIESDPGTPYHHDFTFQPPLPPGSPCFSSPPPLPQGTPPATPTPPPLPKATPLTPTNGSPALKGRSWVGNETVEAAEDDLTLEELEEQQRLIWAALENADTATNSDCETPVLSSPSVSTPVHADTETEENEEAVETTKPAEIGHSEIQRDIVDKEICSQGPGLVNFEDNIPKSPELVKSQDDSHQSPGPVKSQDDSHQSPGPVKSQDDSHQSPGPVKSQDDSHQSPGPVKSQDDSHHSPGPVKSQDDSHHSPGPVKSQDDSHQSPGPVKSQEDSHQSPGPVKSQDDSPQSPGPVKSQDDSPQSPGPVKSQDDSPQSPGPVKSQDDSPQSPGPVRSQDDSPQSPGPVRSQDNSPQSPGPVKSQDDSPKNPGPVRSQDDSPRGTGPVRSQDDSPLNPDPKICQGDNGHGHDPEFLAAEDCASPKHFEKVTAVPHRSNFAAGIVPFEDTPEFTEVAAATGTYLKIRDLLKSSPRNLVKKK